MRIFSSHVPSAHTLFVPSGMGDKPFWTERGLTVIRQLLEVSGHPTPAEERALDGFTLWYGQACDSRTSECPANASYVVSNLNTGAILVFVAWYGYDSFAGSYLGEW